MSADDALKMLEEMILGTQEPRSDFKYVIFLTGQEGEVALPQEYLIELLLLYDTGLFDLDTLSMLFDVSTIDISNFTEEHPACWDKWEESVATMWTRSMRFYEEDLENLSWVAKYAIKRAHLAVKMQKNLIEATMEMSQELDEDAGWDDSNTHMRIDGLLDREKRDTILKDWFNRTGGEVQDGEQ